MCKGIVDRLLQRLGWTTNDPTVVCPEYKIADGRVDYALCAPSLNPIVLIEVKRVGNIAGAEEQLFSYAFHQGVPILILTDGRFWRFFYPSGTGHYTERLVCELDLSDTDNDKNAYQLQRYLSYAAIHNGEAVEAIADDYKKLVSQREVSRHLPRTWQKLVDVADELLIDVLAEATEDACGHKPSKQQVLDFLKSLESTQERFMAHQNDVPSPDPRPLRRSPRSEKYYTYFQALNNEMTEQHNFTDGRSYSGIENVYYFLSGYRGITYHAHFGRGRKVYTGLTIYFSKKEKNKNFFDILKERKSQINAKFDVPLYWERRDEQHGCSIGFGRDGDIESDMSELETIKAWHIENLLKFKAVFTPEIQLALEKLE